MTKPYMEFIVEMSDPRPISVNKMYASGRNGTRFLTTEGRHYKARLCEEIAKAVATLPWKAAVDGVYKEGAGVRLEVILALDRLMNTAWRVGGGTTPSGEPRSPFFKIDATNYIKLIEDAIVQGTGIDDSAHLGFCIEKISDKENPRIIVHYKVFEP